MPTVWECEDPEMEEQYDLEGTTEEDTLSYVDGGCYFPQFFGVTTILYALFAILVVTVVTPDSLQTSAVWWQTDLFLAVAAFLMAIQLGRGTSHTSNTTVLAGTAFAGWSLGLLMRGVLSAILQNTQNETAQVLLYHVSVAFCYSIWAISLFFILQIVTESWKSVKFQIMEEQGLEGVKQRTSPWSWINAARTAFVVALLGATIALGGSLWIALVSLLGQTTENMTPATSTVIAVGQGMLVAAYLIFFMAAAIIWGFQARQEEVFLTDFFLPPQVAVSGMLWCVILSGTYRTVLLFLHGKDSKNRDTPTLNDILAPLVLQYMTLAIMIFCHNLILSFFPGEPAEADDHDDTCCGVTADKKWSTSSRSLQEVHLSFDDDELNQYLRPGEEVLGYHYELDSNSIEEGNDNCDKVPKRRRSLGFRRNRSGNTDTKLSTDAVKVLFGERDDSLKSDDDEELGKIAANGHTYGKYDDFVFGQDPRTNITMLPLKRDGTPDLTGFATRGKMDKERELQQVPNLTPVAFIQSLSILPTAAPDRDDDGSIESTLRSSRSNQSAINNRGSPSHSVGMDGNVLPNTSSNTATEKDCHQPTTTAAAADFFSALSPWALSSPAKPSTRKSIAAVAALKKESAISSKNDKVRNMCADLDVRREFQDRIQSVASTLSDAASGCFEKGLTQQNQYQQAVESSVKKRDISGQHHSDERTTTSSSAGGNTSFVKNDQSTSAAVGPSILENMASAMQNVDNLWTSWMNTAAAAATAASLASKGKTHDSESRPEEVESSQDDNLKRETTEEELSQSTEQSSRHLPFRNLVVEKSGNEESLRFQDDEIGSFANDGYYEDVIVLDADGRPTLGPNVRNLVQYWDLGKANAEGADVIKNNNHAVVRSRTLESKEDSKSKKKYRGAFGSFKRGMKRIGSRTRSRSKSPVYEEREESIIHGVGETNLRKTDSRDTDVGLVIHRY